MTGIVQIISYVCVCFQIKSKETLLRPPVACSVRHPISCNIQSQHSHFILSHTVTQALLCQCPLQTVCTHKVRLIQQPHAYMTEVGLGRIQALGPKWVAGYGPCRKWALLWGGDKRRTSQDTVTSCPRQQWYGGPAGDLQRKPLRRAFRRITRRARGLQVLRCTGGFPLNVFHLIQYSKRQFYITNKPIAYIGPRSQATQQIKR